MGASEQRGNTAGGGEGALRIAQVIASSGAGGMERHVADLARGLCQRGQTVTLISAPSISGFSGSPAQLVELPLHRDRRSPMLLWPLLRHLRSARYDVIHAQGSKAAHCLATLRPLLSAFTVGTQHNIKRDSRMFRRLDAAIAVSRVVARGMDNERVQVIYHGLAQQAEVVAAEFERDTGPLALAVGRLVPAKGFERLIELWPDLPGTLLIAGEGPERARLEQLIATRGLGGRVRLLGHVGDVPALMKAVDGVIVTSWREGFSYVVAEALVCGCPVLSTDVPVANEVLPQELTLADDPAAMRQALRRWLSDVDLWRETCTPAFAFARSTFRMDRMVDDTLALYQRGLAERGAACRVGAVGS